jgi:hypothetical protein
MSKKRPEHPLVSAVREMHDAIKNGTPMQQTVMRRMKVKGKTVFTREKFTAPIRRPAK